MPDQQSQPPTFVQPAESPGAGHTGDRVASIALLAVSGLIATALAFAGLMLVMSSDSCSVMGDCNLGLFTVGWVLSMAVPVLGFAATLVVTIVRIARGKTAFWIPIAGTAAFGVGFALSVVLAFHALG